MRISPTTREYREHVDEKERISAAAGMYAREKDAAFTRAANKHGLWTVREPDCYRRGGERSYWADFVANAAEAAGRSDIPSALVGDLTEARKRLAVTAEQGRRRAEQRDLDTTATHGGGFASSVLPQYLGELFATAARARSVTADVFGLKTLPETGTVIKTPRITTGVSTAVMATENSNVSETDIVESEIVSPVETVAGQSDMSQQFFDRANPDAADVVITDELAASLATNVDVSVFTGTGLNGQTFGLKNVAGITSNAYTDATSTQQEAFVAVLKLYGDVANALGKAPDRILMRPNRRAWFLNWRDSATGAAAVIPWPCAVTEAPAILNTLGAGTEDEIFIVNTSELPVFASEPAFRVSFGTANSGNMTVRITAFQYVATLFNRRPEAIGRLSGTGLIAPVFA